MVRRQGDGGGPVGRRHAWGKGRRPHPRRRGQSRRQPGGWDKQRSKCHDGGEGRSKWCETCRGLPRTRNDRAATDRIQRRVRLGVGRWGEVGNDTVRTHQTAAGSQEREHDDESGDASSAEPQGDGCCFYLLPATVRARGARRRGMPLTGTCRGQDACDVRAREHRPDRLSAPARAPVLQRRESLSSDTPENKPMGRVGGGRHDTWRFPPVVSRRHPGMPPATSGPLATPIG